ncbi:MAG TPA: putative baseplate assembly protein [Pyrinomonadaceae bacterium]|nr:putative baseplate assembly protein [Pyrinomonadaceae bacterium]
MKEEPAPLVDPRSAQEISRQLRKLLAGYAPQWKEQEGTEAGALSDAIIGIFSRFSEIVIQRLNQTPEKNLLAYLDMLGLSILPPQPARVPLTFFLTPGSTTDAVVPVGTQVAAQPAEGEAQPVVFETEQELTVVAARLTAAITRDPARDAYTDQSALIYAPLWSGAQIFRAETQTEHILYIGHEQFLSHPALRELRLVFELSQTITKPKKRQLVWELWNGAQWSEIAPKPANATAVTPYVEDGTAALTKSGEVLLTNLPVVQPVAVNGVERRWLRCRLVTPIPPAEFNKQPPQLPTIKSVRLSALLERTLDSANPDGSLLVEAAFLNYAPVDVSTSFLAFGEKPRVGDALYLAQSEAFAAAGAKVTLDINLTRPEMNPATNQPFPSVAVTHAWEFWDGRTWATLFTSNSSGAIAPANQGFSDGTRAFTRSGRVSFSFPRQPARTQVSGVENYWVRVRIISGDYGKEAYYTLKPKPPNATPPPPDEYTLVPASFAPPTVNALGVGYSVTKNEPPDGLMAYNDFSYETAKSDAPFAPFKPLDETPASLYFGFTLPDGRGSFPNRVVSLYVGVDSYLYGRKPDVATPTSPPRLVWEYSNGVSWSKLALTDGTQDFTREGLLEFLAPPDFKPRREFGLDCYWVRVGWASGEYQFNPRVRLLSLNTTMAAQTSTVRNENLGSSDASANQKFLTTAAPVLAGQQLEVREPDRPSAEERARIESEEGADAISETFDELARPLEIWVRWHEVPDFYGSDARDRHYVVNHQTGEVYFGDGLNGMIPPRGAGNLRMTFYQTGGGSAGNRPAATITELKTTVPYVDSVGNVEPATGGADAESRDSLIRRGPRTIRHRDRAVTAQDYEDLAMMASPGVARVKCVPLQDLAVGIDLKNLKTGVVSLIVVPYSTDAKPYPDLELLDTVRSYLDRRRAADGRLVIVGPEYIRVAVQAEVVPESITSISRLEGVITDALTRFLHPLTGGAEATGWNFGRKPHASDIYAVIEAVAGVAYVRQVRLSGSTEVNGVETEIDFEKLSDGQEYFLVYSGDHKIDLVFE